MKTEQRGSNIRARKSEQGSALLMALILVLVTMPFLWYCMRSVDTQHRSVIRSQNWNANIPIVEAGVEEAFAHLNRNCYSNLINAGVVNWSADGWTNLGGGKYQAPRRQIGDSYYDVQVSSSWPLNTNMPDIVCVAYVPALYAVSEAPLFAQAGQDVQSQPSYIARQVRTHTRLKTYFNWGMFAKEDIEWNGNVVLDSFDSGDSTKSNNGMYDPTKATDEAPIASLSNNVALGGGIVYGTGETGPDGSITNGTLGSSTWAATNSGAIDPTRIRDDLSTTVDDTALPSGASTWSTLAACNCSVTVTNPVVSTAQITSDVYPSPVPAGGVITNKSGLANTTNYPTAGNVKVLATNWATDIWTTIPTNMPSGYSIIATNGATWQTNILSQGQPTNYTTPPGIVLWTNWTTNLSSPASGTYVGTITNWTTGSGKKKQTWYAYSQLLGWAYKVSATYTVKYPIYQVEGYTYTYTGSVTNYQAVTSTYQYAPSAGNYQLGNLSLSGQNKMLIKAPGLTQLYITGTMSMSGQSQIVIENGASLAIYVAGNVDLKGQGIDNPSGNANNFGLWGLPTCTDIAIGGNAAFTGTIYAPQAFVHAGGGGNDSYDIVGSIVGKKIKFNGHFNMHYDTALKRNGPSQGFIADGWAEEKVGTQ